MKRNKLDDILDQFPEEEILIADGYDDCIIGYDYGIGDIRIIYSVKKILNKLVKKDYMTEEEAIEHFEYNMRGGYVGEKTPIWCQDDF
jgi:hypothetical protein